MSDDKTIWNKFRNGDPSALSSIYYQNAQLLYSYGQKFTNNQELIKDTIHDLFIDLIRTRKKLGVTDNIHFYLIASFRRKLLRSLKSKNKLIEKQNSDKIFEKGMVFSVEEDMINKEENDYLNRHIRKEIQKLSSKQQEILYYRFNCDFDYEQICELMDIKYDSARKQVSRAIKTIKSNLKMRIS